MEKRIRKSNNVTDQDMNVINEKSEEKKQKDKERRILKTAPFGAIQKPQKRSHRRRWRF